MQDGNAVPAADLAADGAHPQARISGQDPVAAPRRPDGMVPVAMDAMHGAIIPHVPVLPETGLCPKRAAHFRKDRDITRFVLAEAISDWKPEASNQRVESELVTTPTDSRTKTHEVAPGNATGSQCVKALQAAIRNDI